MGVEYRGRFDRVAPTNTRVDFECVIKIAGQRYDLSSWANAHPGGAEVLRKYNGLDATKAFERVGHSPDAYRLLGSFAIDPKEKLSENIQDTNGRDKSMPSTWKKKLLTPEDPHHFHKTCGIFVLLNYTWRFYQMYFGEMSADLVAGWGQVIQQLSVWFRMLS